jgi:hypothetical protein
MKVIDMRVCGIELKGAEAVICLLDYELGTFNAADCRMRSITLTNAVDTQATRAFNFAFAKLAQDYKIERFVIIERFQKGKFAGSAASFKMEAALQLLDFPVHVLNTTDIKELIKRNPLDINVLDLGLKKFQQPAFSAAYAYLNQEIYSTEEE